MRGLGSVAESLWHLAEREQAFRACQYLLSGDMYMSVFWLEKHVHPHM